MNKVDPSTALFYKMSRENNGNTIGVLAELEGELSKRYVVNCIENMITCYPILSQILVEHDQGLEWKKHTIVEITNHFTHIEKKRYDKRNFQHTIDTILEKEFTREQPEWEFHLITYKKSKKSFLFLKANHIYGDGHQISHYLKLFMDGPKITYPKIKKKSISIFYKIYAFMMSFFNLIYVLLFFRRRELPIDKKDNSFDKARFLHCHTWNLDEIKKIKNHYGVSINDLFYTIITEALREYCNKPIQLSSLSMVNLRDLSTFSPNEETTLEQQNNIGFISLSTNIKECSSTHLFKNSQSLSYFKHSPFIYIMVKWIKWISYFSPNIAFYFLRYLGDQSTFGFSNFRAFEKEKTMNGCKVINLSNVVIPYRVGSLFTLVSYYDKITLNVTYRERNITDQKKFVKCIEHVYNQLKDKAIDS